MRYLNLFLILLSPQAQPLNVGDLVADFSLTATDGKIYSLKKEFQAHTAAVLAFIATKCPYSNAYNDRYNQLFDELKIKWSGKIVFLAINSNDTEPFDEVKGHAKEKGFKFSVLKDEKHGVADLLGAERTPEVFLIDNQMRILYHGRIDDDTEGKNIKRRDLSLAIGEFLSAKPVSIKETKAFGCTIKRK